MNLLQSILTTQGGGVVNQIASQFGLEKSQAQAAISQLVPALARGVQNNTSSQDGIQAFSQAIQSGNHQRYVEQPQNLSNPETQAEGNAILGHLFGSKEVSRQVAGRAAQNTGIDANIMKQMLPILASAVMGSMGQKAQQVQSGGGAANLVQGLMGLATGGSSKQGGNAMMGMLSGFLDADKDGSAFDDVLGMIARKSA